MTENGAGGVRSWLVDKIVRATVSIANKRLDIAELQQEHGANLGKVLRITCTDIGKTYHFRVWEGKLELLEKPTQVDGGVEMTSDTLVAIASRRQKRMDPATGHVFWADFTPIDAMMQNSIRFWGKAASNDVLLFARRIYHDVYDTMSGDLRQAIASANNGTKT